MVAQISVNSKFHIINVKEIRSNGLFFGRRTFFFGRMVFGRMGFGRMVFGRMGRHRSWVANGSDTSAYHDLNYLISWICSKTIITAITIIIAEELVYWTLKTIIIYQFNRNEIILRSLCAEVFKMSNVKVLWFIYFCTHLQFMFIIIQVHLEMEYFRSKLL